MAAGYKPPSRAGKKDEAVWEISSGALCLPPSPELEIQASLPTAVLPEELPASSTACSGDLQPCRRWRNRVALQGALSCLKGSFILMPRESVIEVCGYFGWRTSREIQPTPWPPIQFHHKTHFSFVLCSFMLPLNTLFTICASLLAGIFLLHQPVDSNFINV